MKEPVKRLRQTIAIAIIFLVVYTAIMLSVEQRYNRELVMADSVNKTESVRGMIEGYGKTADEIGRCFREDENARVRLETIRLASQIVDGEFTGERLGTSSMVVRVHDGKVELPPGADGLFPMLGADMVASEYEQFRTEVASGSSSASGEDAETEMLLTSGKIGGEWYLVRWTPASDYDTYIRSRLSADRLIEAVQNGNDIELLIIHTADSEEEDGESILYNTKGFSQYSTLGELGITQENLRKEHFTLHAGGKEYICFPIEIENLGFTAICCNSVENEKMAILGDIIWQVFFAAIMLAGLITWCYSVQWMVRRESLDEKRKFRYSPEHVKRRTARRTIMSTLAVTLFGFTTVMVQFMYHENRIGSNVLAMLETQLEDGGSIGLALNELDTERFTGLGETASAMLTEDPALLNKNGLAQISEAISADYLILFDEKGEEIACSRDYIGFALPTDKSDSMYDFRRLLRGVSSIAHGPGVDMITGERRSFVGVRYDVPGKKDTYGALLIAFPAQGAASKEERTEIENDIKKEIYERIHSRDRLIMEIDPETHRVVSCSRKAYVGADMESLGMDSKGLKDRYMNYYLMDDEWYFGITGEVGDSMYYYMRDASDMSRLGLLLALISGGLFLIGYVISAKFALQEYTDENYERYAPLVMETSDAYRQKISQRAPYMDSVAVTWSNMRPENKVKTVMQILTGILLVVMILVSYGNLPVARHSVLTFVIRGNWTKGINLFSMIAVIVTFCVEYLAYLVVKVIALMLVSVTDLRGETVFKLIRSFLNYAMFIGAVCVSLSFLGVDTTTLLASLGLMSLAISLGAKDIVADILAGLSLVFERTYYVGDIVQIGDFKGRVLEIGVRSTKLMSGTQDIKIICNHEIGSVINCSKQNSICTVKICLPVTTSIDEVKRLLEDELALVAKKNPHITKGPHYDGILEFVDDSMVISISAEGPEEYMGDIRFDINQTLQSMAERKLLQYAKGRERR